jgi:hypothetical protein
MMSFSLITTLLTSPAEGWAAYTITPLLLVGFATLYPPLWFAIDSYDGLVPIPGNELIKLDAQ